MVVAVVASLAGFIKARVSKTQVDNTVFRLHYRWTTSFCYLSCALIAASEFIGNPIECLFASEKAVLTYCWISSTYTINTTVKKNDFHYYAAYGSDYSGIGTYNPEIHEKTFQAYYQWVPFVLFFQGCVFYLPHQMWKAVEGKQLDNLLQGLHVFSVSDENLDAKIKNIITYLSNSWGLNNKYCYWYIAAEVLNLVNVVGQMFLLNEFFGGMFLHYGSKILSVANLDEKSRYDPMIETFPRITKCDFFKFGSSGTVENVDYLCILPQNLLNEKIFLIMWVWFVFLAVLTTLQLIYRVVMTQSTLIRARILEQRGRIGAPAELEMAVSRMSLGDYFLLYAIGKNVNAVNYRKIINGVLELVGVSPGLNVVPRIEETLPTAPLYNRSFLNDVGDNTIDRRLHRKIIEEDESNM